LASLLETRGVPLRYIQDLLGHASLDVTKIYLHSPQNMIRKVGEKITEARETLNSELKEPENIVTFKVS
jgi:site-specific recombinase XerD